jgi:prepilin-type N-terminal cleavage/methylation domain-containing protein
MIHDSKFNNKGFTLLEILIAISLLSLIITITVGIFVSGSKSQRKIIELSVAQREGGYLMETISRELRMATDICAVNTDPGCAVRLEMQNKETDKLEFKNYEGGWIIYCKSLENGLCDSNGKYFSRDGKRISSSDVIIEDLKFYTTNDFSLKQPIITIVMKVKAKNTTILLQDSIALRIY